MTALDRAGGHDRAMNHSDVAAQIDYVYWLRDRILGQVAKLDPHDWIATATVTSRDLRSTLVHELDVELSWRKRVRGEPDTEWRDRILEPGDFPTLADLVTFWRSDERETRDWVAGLDDAALAGPVTVNGLWGYPLTIHLLHVVDHAVQSFAEAAVLLSAAGHSPGDLDFLDFYDTPERRATERRATAG
jgi:uncharacterized damage-inducible protein DinB